MDAGLDANGWCGGEPPGARSNYARKQAGPCDRLARSAVTLFYLLRVDLPGRKCTQTHSLTRWPASAKLDPQRIKRAMSVAATILRITLYRNSKLVRGVEP